MGELPAGQLIAGWLAILCAAIAAVGLIRLSRIPTVVVVLAFFGIPVLGWMKYALLPRPLGSFDVMFWAAPFIGVALSLLLASMLLRLGSPRGSTFASILRRAPLFLVAWPCVVLAMSFLVLPFEPGFAVADVAATAAWFLFWIARPVRRFVNSNSYEISSPRDRVFSFISNPTNWPRYMADVESVEVRPPGLLAEGSEIITRRRMEIRGLRGPRLMMPQTIDAVEVVTSVVPNESLASRRSDGAHATATLKLVSVDGRTTVRSTSEVVVPYRLALVGAVIELRLSRDQRLNKARENQARLRKLLEEQAPPK